MASSRRNVAKENEWRFRLKRQRESGLTIPVYCRREGLNEHTFRAWQNEIKKRDAEKDWDVQKLVKGARKSRKAAVPISEPEPQVSFIPITLSQTPEPISARDIPNQQVQYPIEIATPCGHVIRIAAQADIGLLRVCLAAVRRSSC